jgi:hypothetical protein
MTKATLSVFSQPETEETDPLHALLRRGASEVGSVEYPQAPNGIRVPAVYRSNHLPKIERLTMELSFRQSHGRKAFLKGISKLQGSTKPDT